MSGPGDPRRSVLVDVERTRRVTGTVPTAHRQRSPRRAAGERPHRRPRHDRHWREASVSPAALDDGQPDIWLTAVWAEL
jgi:hypothetical protein